MIDPNPNDRTDPPEADEDATEESGAGYGNHAGQPPVPPSED